MDYFKLFSGIILATFLGVHCASAVPLQTRDDPLLIPYTFFTPSNIWLYNTGTGSIALAPTGAVSKFPRDGGQDTTTLLTFTYPPDVLGKECQFEFFLDPTASVSGSGKLDLFSSLSPVSAATSGWGPGNQRNDHLGRLSTSVDGFATWDATYSAYLTEKTDCQAPGTVEGYELVGVYDDDFVSWDPSVAGLRIVYT